MNRAGQCEGTSHRVLYFLCKLERCGDEDFVSRLRPVRVDVPRADDDASRRTLLFSTN